MISPPHTRIVRREDRANDIDESRSRFGENRTLQRYNIINVYRVRVRVQRNRFFRQTLERILSSRDVGSDHTVYRIFSLFFL